MANGSSMLGAIPPGSLPGQQMASMQQAPGGLAPPQPMQQPQQPQQPKDEAEAATILDGRQR